VVLVLVVVVPHKVVLVVQVFLHPLQEQMCSMLAAVLADATTVIYNTH
jgi:hypothetical protein